MRVTIRKVRAELTREYPVKLYQWLTIWAAVLTIVFGGIYGAVAYSNDRADSAQRSADFAAFENARDERTRCEQRVESREQIRGAFESVYVVIDNLNPDNRFTLAARVNLDETYPTLSISECPPIPIPPEEP